jgi:hypothetical protein
MRLSYIFPAVVVEDSSGTEVPAPEAITNRELATRQLETYFDPNIADAGIVGGRIRAIAHQGKAAIEVTYWFPPGTPPSIIEQLTEYTVAQLKDGVGEGGLELEVDGERLRVIANTYGQMRAEVVEDGQVVPQPSPVAIAAREGNLEALRSTLERNSEAIERLHQGYSPLQLAILFGHGDAARILLTAGADPNRLDVEGLSPLELCAISNSIDDVQSHQIAELLLKAGANPHHVSPQGETAKSYAATRGKRRMADLL